MFQWYAAVLAAIMMAGCNINDDSQDVAQKPVVQEQTQQETQAETVMAQQEENKEIQVEEEKQMPTVVADPVQAPAQPTENSPDVGYEQRESWWFRRNNEHLPPSAQEQIAIGQYGAYYLGDTQSKVIYLTFDEGYELGYTPQILDILKENEVPAAFFVTKSYVKECPDLVKRMTEEGHIVGNHSTTHPDFTTLSDEQIVQELEECANSFQEVTGKEMPHYFRPPEGVYSIRVLEKAKECGYKTIFWSYAYADWDPDKQPGKQAAYDMAMNHYHNGCIMLLHAVSQSNTEALDSILKDLKAQGYTFLSLDYLKDNLGL